MLKPLIVIVDDDRAVLHALEAELTPAFAEIARIQAFDAPEDVLASIPRWSEEGRPIAVAVVDQKMPGMTGVELLVALRGLARDASRGAAFHPAHDMRSVVLTGYAGLESALECSPLRLDTHGA